MGIEELNRQFITPRGRWMAELWPSKDLSYDAFDLKGYGRILVLSQRALPCLHSSIITDCMYYVKGFDYLYPPNLYPPNFCSVATLTVESVQLYMYNSAALNVSLIRDLTM